MATKKQIAANRRNARKSTGPRTAEGKAKVAGNAVTHGLTARAAVLPDEDAAEFEAFAAGVRADLAPLGALEEALAARVAEGMWRLLRVGRIEAACFAYELAQTSERAGRLREIPGLPPSAAHGEEHPLGAAFLKLDADGLPNSLTRYEAAIQRGVERSLKLLQDTRKLRAAAENTAPRDEPISSPAQAGQGLPGEQPSEAHAESERTAEAPEAPMAVLAVVIEEVAAMPVADKPTPYTAAWNSGCTRTRAARCGCPSRSRRARGRAKRSQTTDRPCGARAPGRAARRVRAHGQRTGCLRARRGRRDAPGPSPCAAAWSSEGASSRATRCACPSRIGEE